MGNSLSKECNARSSNVMLRKVEVHRPVSQIAGIGTECCLK